MPKKKKYPRLKNGFGSIRKLSGNRTNPYAVFAPSTCRDERGYQIYDKALAYCPTWEIGFSVLAMYHTGQYKEGDSVQNLLEDVAHSQLTPVVNKILSVLNIGSIEGETFVQVYDKFMEWKFSDNNRKLSESSLNSYKAAFKNCTALHNKVFTSLKTVDLQKVVDDCPLKHSSKELIVNLFKQMYKYADIHELVEKDYSAHVSVNIENDDIKGVPFTADDIKKLWADSSNPICANILIMIYSGLRISEYASAEINLKEGYFFGGVKTDAGKNRYVPIHTAIMPLIKQNPKRLNGTSCTFRLAMYEVLERLGVEKHTPHDCRHTFAMLCDESGIKESDKKMMLGHSFQDVTNAVYGHRTLDYLKEQIELIKVNK